MLPRKAHVIQRATHNQYEDLLDIIQWVLYRHDEIPAANKFDYINYLNQFQFT